MQRCDALIVGGGPAGSSCARELVRGGMSVIVLDKSVFPRDKTCAGWITPDVLRLLTIDAAEYARQRVFQTIRGFCVSRIGGRAAKVMYDRPVSYGIRRCEFDHYLLQRSAARVCPGELVRSIERVGGCWRINGGFEAPLVIGAGGHSCPVAQYLGATIGGASRVVVAQEIEFAMNDRQARACPIDPEAPELYFCEDLRGYGWCFRKGAYLNVGLGREDASGLSAHMQRFVEDLIGRGRIPHDVPRRFRGHAYTLYGHAPRQLVGDGLLLVGDAAGLAYPLSGEGILTAVESGRLAAETALAAAGQYDGDRLQGYGTRLTERFGPVESGDGWLAHIPGRVKLALAGWLFSTPWFARRVVLERWFLHTRPARSVRPAQLVVAG